MLACQMRLCPCLPGYISGPDTKARGWTGLRVAHEARQIGVAPRVGIARGTAGRHEKGDPAVAVGQLLRWLNALFLGLLLVVQQLSHDLPGVLALHERELTEQESTDVVECGRELLTRLPGSSEGERPRTGL